MGLKERAEKRRVRKINKWKTEIDQTKKFLDDYWSKLGELIELETEDVINAVTLALTKGRDAKDELEDLSGNPYPESVAFEITLIGKDLIQTWINQQLGLDPDIVRGFLEGKIRG